ncbi:hypothetical protein B0813_003002 [Candidatus Fervidibacteria bacterium JGI MDM2 SSWTFF-3-K9]
MSYKPHNAFRAMRQSKRLARLMKANFPNYYPVMITLTFAKPFKPSTSANLQVISNFIQQTEELLRPKAMGLCLLSLFRCPEKPQPIFFGHPHHPLASERLQTFPKTSFSVLGARSHPYHQGLRL